MIVNILMSEILNTTELKNEGNQLFKNKNYKEAIEKYMEALAYSNSDEENSVLHSNISATYCKLEEFGKALDHAAVATKKNPDWYKAWYRLSFVLYKLEKIDQAKKAIDKTLELCEEDLDTNNNFEFIKDLKKDIYSLDKKMNSDGNETEDEDDDEKVEPKISLGNDNSLPNGFPNGFPNGLPNGLPANLMPMMDNIMKNEKIKSKLDSKEFQEKVMQNQSNPFAMLNDPDMREIMGEMMKNMTL